MTFVGAIKNIGVGGGGVNAAAKHAGRPTYWPFGNPSGMHVAEDENGSL